MSNASSNTKKTAKKPRRFVQEMEEVQFKDKRGNIKFELRPKKLSPKRSPVSNRTPLHNQKRRRLKSPSPVASGSHIPSDIPIRKPKPSKVCIIYIHVNLLIIECCAKCYVYPTRVKMTFCENGSLKGRPFCNFCLTWKVQQVMGLAASAKNELANFDAWTASATWCTAIAASWTVTSCCHFTESKCGMA